MASYDLLRRHAPLLARALPGLLVCDEGHRLKNWWEGGGGREGRKVPRGRDGWITERCGESERSFVRSEQGTGGCEGVGCWFTLAVYIILVFWR